MIPAKYRDELSPNLVITRNPIEPCLFVFPMTRWTAFADELDKRSMLDPTVALLRRTLFSAAEDLKADAQGRIIINQSLRDYAQIQNDILITGLYTYVEFWSPPIWQEKVASHLGDVNVNGQLFSAIGL